MADELKMDPGRIARLRNPERLEQVDPMRVLTVAGPLDAGPILDVGAGVGFVTLPFARHFAARDVVAVDILQGMLDLLAADAAANGLDNLKTALMPGPTALPFTDGVGAMLIMLQVHHELDDAAGLMTECRRVLAPGAPMVIVDWKPVDLPGVPKGGRRVPEARIVEDLVGAGFVDVGSHDLYPAHATVIGRAP